MLFVVCFYQFSILRLSDYLTVVRYLKAIYYFFPIQLLLLTLRRYPVFMLIWLLLFGVVTGAVGTTYGAQNILCDPEYLGETGYLSFVMVGMAFGIFFVAWNINCYLLHSQNFPFLANDFRPMGTFFLNNAIIPATFIGIYFRNIILYQSRNEASSRLDIGLDLLGFAAGTLMIILLTAVYYSFTNKDKLKRDDSKKRFRFFFRRHDTFTAADFEAINVQSLLLQNLKVQTVWQLQPKDYEDARVIFRQHHINVFFAQTAILLLIFLLGFVVENPLFQLPVACSVLLFLAALTSILGAMIYWTGKWSLILIVLFLLFLNDISQYNFMGYKSEAYGLNYDLPQKRPYNVREFRALASDSNIRADIAYFNNILKNWKQKQKGGNKPKLIFVNTSGGGSRSAMFTGAVLQQADSILDGKLFDKTFLMSGASGGMFGVAAMRELFLEKKLGSQINLYDRKYPYDLAADMLNPMFVSLLSNDLVSPVHFFTLDSMRYNKDRGYMMEQQLIKNLEGRLDKRLKDYRSFEYNAVVPLIIAHTTVVADSRRFYMSPHPVRFLMRQPKEYQSNTYSEIDAIDFCSFFEKENGENMRFTSALRMSASFPFILPNTELPTVPPIVTMDGGASDNYGTETTIRFIQTFKDWINENTSGVVIIQIRDNKKDDDIDIETVQETTLDRLTNPIGQFIFNLDNYQDYRIDQQLNFTNLALRVKMQMITFEYEPEKREEKAAVSLHLTELEKRNIISALYTPNNQLAFRLLKEWAQ